MTTPLTLSEITFGNLIKRGWTLLKENFVFLAGSFLAVIIIQMLFSALIGEGGQSSEGAASIFYLLMQIVMQFVAIGWLNVAIRASRNEPLEVSNFIDKAGLFFKFILTNLLVSVLIFFGLILLIVPGIYLALKYMFVTYAVVDKGVGPFEALTISSTLTKGIKLKLVLYGLGFVGLNILGMLALGIGLAITMPITTLAYAVLYNALLEKADGGVPAQTTGATVTPAAPAQPQELSGTPPQSL